MTTITEQTPQLQRPSFARKPPMMIGQAEARQKMMDALDPGDRSFQVVLLHAEGGMGKTRLLQELQEMQPRRSGETDRLELPHPDGRDKTVITKLVDVIDAELHDRYRFVTALQKKLEDRVGKSYFREFRLTDEKVKTLTASGALIDAMNKAQEEAAAAFLKDLKVITEERRVVFLVDTVERLSYEPPRRFDVAEGSDEDDEPTVGGNEWLLKQRLLNESDLTIRTHHWLKEFITGYDLRHVTLVLAGRGEEGKTFFKHVRDWVPETAPGHALRRVEISLRPLSAVETREFFQAYADLYGAEEGAAYRAVAVNFARVADPGRDTYKVIRLYTGGRPILLAMYAHVLAEGREVPAPFRLTFRDACRRANLPEKFELDASPEPDTPELQRIRWQIEEAFVNLLFDAPVDRRRAVLRALVRAPRGLTVEQLHYYLDAPAGTKPADWRPDPEKLGELSALLNDITADYLVKRRTDDDMESSSPDQPERLSTPLRIGLQDELYRIYANHMGLLAEPLDPRTVAIRQSLDEADRRRYQQNHADEVAERKTLYAKLADFAAFQHERYLAAKRDLLDQDETEFERNFSLENPHSYRFRELLKRENEEREFLHHMIAFHEIEHMVYRLLQDPERNLNEEYITLEDDNDKAARQEEDFWAQEELWQELFDNPLMKFLTFRTDRSPVKERGESPVDVLRRVAMQENVARWIKRFVLRGVSQDAVAFGGSVNLAIDALPRPTGDDPESKSLRHQWDSWNHTMAREERNIWTLVAKVRLGREVDTATEDLNRSIDNLRRLFVTDVDTIAFEFDDRIEKGFAPLPGDPASAHPAYVRLSRLLSHAHNILAYARRTVGRMHDAVLDYAKAVEYVRPDVGHMEAHRAKVLNNLSRALSELGWNGVDVCLDALNQRWKLAEEVPLAGSYNTMALLLDDMGRYEEGPLLSAKAVAYCRRAVERRQLGLSLRQLAESLRHVAERRRTRQRTGTPDALYDQAESLLKEALIVFEELGEMERVAEVNLELGSLFRDRLRTTRPAASSSAGRDSDRAMARNKSEALLHLDVAEQLSREYYYLQHEMDARVNRAQVRYYAGEPERARRILLEMIGTKAYEFHVITGDYMPNGEDEELRNRNWVFRYLYTAHKILSRTAMDRFDARVAHFRAMYPEDTREDRQKRQDAIANDDEAKIALRDAAEAYALGIAYVELFSPHSRSIGTLQGDLYTRLCKFNRVELDLFRKGLEEADLLYPSEEGAYPRLDSFKMLKLLFDEYFGQDIVPAAAQEDSATHVD